MKIYSTTGSQAFTREVQNRKGISFAEYDLEKSVVVKLIKAFPLNIIKSLKIIKAQFSHNNKLYDSINVLPD